MEQKIRLQGQCALTDRQSPSVFSGWYNMEAWNRYLAAVVGIGFDVVDLGV